MNSGRKKYNFRHTPRFVSKSSRSRTCTSSWTRIRWTHFFFLRLSCSFENRNNFCTDDIRNSIAGQKHIAMKSVESFDPDDHPYDPISNGIFSFFMLQVLTVLLFPLGLHAFSLRPAENLQKRFARSRNLYYLPLRESRGARSFHVESVYSSPPWRPWPW